jgi:alpha-mannosidase
MLETLRRCRAVSNNTEVGGGELPKVQMGSSVDDFYDDLVKRTDGGKELPTWFVPFPSSSLLISSLLTHFNRARRTSELYLELHRGTATSHGSIKLHNRRTEVLLHDIELLSTLATVLGAKKGRKGFVYPKDELDKLWEDGTSLFSRRLSLSSSDCRR